MARLYKYTTPASTVRVGFDVQFERTLRKVTERRVTDSGNIVIVFDNVLQITFLPTDLLDVMSDN